MGGVAATLLDYGWTPSEDRFTWARPLGASWEVRLNPDEAVLDVSPFMEAVEQSIWDTVWRRAAGHYLGEGLADGCDTWQLRRYLQKLEWHAHVRCHMRVLATAAAHRRGHCRS